MLSCIFYLIFLLIFFMFPFFLSPCVFPNNVLYFVGSSREFWANFRRCSGFVWLVMYSCFLSARLFSISFFKLYQCYNLWNEDIGYGSEQKINSFYIQENVTFRAYSYISSALCLIAVFTMGLFSRGSICLMAQGILSKSYR